MPTLYENYIFFDHLSLDILYYIMFALHVFSRQCAGLLKH